MIRRVFSLYNRYEAAHLVLTQNAPKPINDESGQQIGTIAQATFAKGRLSVSGTLCAKAITLSFLGAQTKVELDATEANTPFDLALPARLSDVIAGAAPDLRIEQASGAELTKTLTLPKAARWRMVLAFVKDGAQAAPAALKWFATKDPLYRDAVKTRLNLGLTRQAGPLSTALFSDPKPTPQEKPAAAVTIVLPVYNAHDLLQQCLERIVRHTDLSWRLILIEDGSSDTRIRPMLRDWVTQHPQATLLENPQNLGFIASVNRGLQLATSEVEQNGPVILLNSDALVPQNWASRLVRPLIDQPDVASVTPMSNDAEIFSVPAICARQMLDPGQADAIDAIAQRFAPNAELHDVPTGVGFCMALSRDWLAKVPQLDPAFGRGYGEEVDWCQKTAKLGGRHLAQPALFVEHRGGESFGSAQKAALIAQNHRIIFDRYPDYDQAVQDFITADPLRTARMALGLASAGQVRPDNLVPVYLAHSLGGGADHWLEAQIATDLSNGMPSVVLRVGGALRWQLELHTPAGVTTGWTSDTALVQTLLSLLPRRHVVYSCGVGDRDPFSLPDLLCALRKEGDSAEMLFHDYFPLSPSHTLLDSDGLYRGPVSPPRTDKAHQITRPNGDKLTLTDWQTAWRRFADCAQLTVFSESSAEHVTAVWPELAHQIVVTPHDLPYDIPTLPQPDPSAPPVIAVLGNIGAQKGAYVLQALAKRMARENHPAKLVLIGNIDPAISLPKSVQVYGQYAVNDLPHLAARFGITAWLIPSIWPETFCFTVHEALETGLPVMAFDLGAQGHAVRSAPNGVPLSFDAGGDLVHILLSAPPFQRLKEA